MKTFPQPVDHIKAETFLTSFLDSCRDVIIEPHGVFFRNYDNDVISVDADEYDRKMVVKISRDGLFQILPESLFFVENKLREIGKKGDKEKFKQEEERIRKEKQNIKTFFQPFDVAYFKLRFELEKKLNHLATNRAQIIIDELIDDFGIDAENPIVRKMLPLAPIASEFRGNKFLLKDVLKILFYPANVEILLKRSKASGMKGTILKFIVYIEELSAEQFRTMKKDVEGFSQFFYEWFLPVDMGCEFKIADKNERFILGKSMTLGYNTYL
jgi:hypothetical protein